VRTSLVLLVALAGLAPGTGVPASAPPGPGPAAVYGDTGPTLRLATGSPGELGLVEALAHAFARQEPIRLAWHKAGSGTALAMLRAGDVDLVMVHAPTAEQAAVVEGWASRRTAIGGNAYYLVGPVDDPAGVRDAEDVLEALRRIARAEAKFVTRGDQSGTHRQELGLWREAGIQPDWTGYLASNDFMAASLRLADREGAYFLTDSSTWVVLQGEIAVLRVLFADDPRLVNTYHALLASDGPALDMAGRFLDFLAAPAGQAVIRDFGLERHGAPLYLDAGRLAQ
jgi:tungstate transport system substrate-binding protein